MTTSQHQAPASLPSQISHFHELPTVIRRAFLRRILTKYQILSIGKVVFQNFMIGFEFKIKLNYWRSRKTPLEAPSRPIFAVERSQNFTAGNKMSIKLIINPVKRWPQKEDWFVSQFKPVSMTIPMTMTKRRGWGGKWKECWRFFIFSNIQIKFLSLNESDFLNTWINLVRVLHPSYQNVWGKFKWLKLLK